MGVRYCSKCGTQLPETATFCPSCGAAVSQESSPQLSPMAGGSYRRRNEKEEKAEKHEKGEKGRGGDVTGAVIGGLILIWLGVTFYLQQTNSIPASLWWAYFLAGLGAILLVQGVIRRTRSGRPFIGSFIGGAILLFIGLASIFERTISIWPLILVVIGGAVIASGFARRRVPSP